MASSTRPPTPRRSRERSSAAPTNSRKSGAGRVGPRLELGVELRGDEPRMIGQLDHLDEAALLEGAADREARVDELLAVGVVHLVAVAVALGDDRLAAVDLAGLRCPRRARPPARRAASSRRDPRRPSGRAAGRSPGTASRGPSRSSSRPSRPQTWRANSETATCIPRQMPRYGIASSRATRQARIFPSQPREPKPPGTSTPSTPASSARASSSVMFSASTQRTLTSQPFWIPACRSASCTER